MRTFIQLRDGVGYATLKVVDGEPDHTVTPDHTTAIEVFTENPDDFLKMKYDEKTKSWSPAPLIIYGVVDDSGNIIELRRTVFEHETEGHVLIPEDFQGNWRWVNNEWVKPEIIDVTIQDQLALQAPEETEEERLARVRAATGQ